MTNWVTQFRSSRFFYWGAKILKTVVTVAIVGLIAVAGYKLIVDYNLFAALTTTGFVVATALAIGYRVVNPYGWTLVLASLGYEVSAWQSIKVWLVAESRRWLPGGVWGYTSRAVAAGKLGVPVSVASASMVVELLITMAAAVFLGLLGLAFHYQALGATLTELWQTKLAPLGQSSWIGIGCGVAVLFGVAALVLRKKFMSKVAGLLGKLEGLRSIKLSYRKLGMALVYMLAMAGMNGLVNQSLVAVVSPESSVPVLVMMAATAVAWIVGFLAIFSPGGILVREGTLAALLLPWLPYEVGFTIAILSRIAQLLAEVTCMLPVCFAKEPTTSTTPESAA